MKKLLSILTMGIAISANAQEQSIVKLPQTRSGEHLSSPVKGKTLGSAGLQEIRAQRNANAGKGTDGVNGEWFSFTDAQFVSGQSDLSLYPLYQDSSLLVIPQTPPNFNWWVNGLGTSFDPTSLKFNVQFINLGATPPTFAVQNDDAYTVDSVFVFGFYNQIHSQYVDTLFIDVAAADATTPNSFRLTYNINGDPWPFATDSLGIPDARLRAAFPTYDYVNNRISDSIPNVQRIVKILDAAAYADTTANGFHAWAFPINLPVGAGGKVVALATFKSGFAYPLNTNIDSANSWWHAAYELNGTNTFPQQNSNDYNAGLIVRHYERYQFGDTSGFQGHALPVTTYLWDRGAGFDDPVFDFHIKCPQCDPVSVKDVNANLSELNAYPNPANNEVNIVFASANAGKANVTVSNAIGQVVESKVASVKANEMSKVSFSTANLANGVYFYTVEANGQRQTSRFVVAH